MIALQGEPDLRIRVRSHAAAFELNAPYRASGCIIPTGRFDLRYAGTDFQLSNREFAVRVHPGDIFRPVDPSGTFSLPDTPVGEGFHWSHNEELVYPGSFSLRVENGCIDILNIVPLEQYLSSVISSEMSSTAPRAFLEAHAVVSRSWVLAQLDPENRKSTAKRETAYDIWEWFDREDHEGFDLCSDDHCQRYHGLGRSISPEARHAVAETRGTILSADDEVVDARFSKCCGGISERFSAAWQDVEPPGITSILDAAGHSGEFAYPIESEKDVKRWIDGKPAVFCNASPDVWDRITVDMDKKTTAYFRWHVSYEQEELATLIEEKISANLGLIRGIDIVRRGPSGRAIVVRIRGERRSITMGKELAIRRILSPTHLKSSAIIIEPGTPHHGIPASFTIRGAGWGHGVGMCQIGAGSMAMHGYDFRSILSHYFPTAELQTLY